MSVKWTTQVWENSGHKGTDLLCLLAIADNANDEGIAWPSMATIAKKSRLSERQTTRVIKKLVASGELKITEKAKGVRSNRYQIAGEWNEPRGDTDDTSKENARGDTCDTSRGDTHDTCQIVTHDTDDTSRGDIQGARGDIAVSPEPSLEPSLEPSGSSFADTKAALLSEQQMFFGKVCEIVGWDYGTIDKSSKGQVAQTVGVLKRNGYTLEELNRFGREVWAKDWRWKKSKSRPTLTQLRQEIGKLRATSLAQPEDGYQAHSGDTYFEVSPEVEEMLRTGNIPI